jgi:Xaa-Pro aminopeptidase
MNIKIPVCDFNDRVQKLRYSMSEAGMDVCVIYGDEYRRENLRYISNYWPLFERGAAIIALKGDPILLAAPEGERVCREMSVWKDIRVIPDFACVTVPDNIEYPQANYTSFKSVIDDIGVLGKVRRIGIVGLDAMSSNVYHAISNSCGDAAILDANPLIYQLRLTKSENEINCLAEAARIADEGYKAMLMEARAGITELRLEAAASNAAKNAGAEYIPFCLVSSGKRVETIIGRATNKVISNGDMVMAALAVQFEGYIATVNFPFVVGDMTEGQRHLINILVEGDDIALRHLRGGAPQKDLVRAVKAFFNSKGVSQYDLYPPLHGCGVAEAESPYPNGNTEGNFTAGMTVNVDLSLFGHPDGSNRIEEGLLVTDDGYRPLSTLVRALCKQWRELGEIKI